MHVEAWPLGEPRLYGGMLMNRIVLDNQMCREFRRHIGVEMPQEAQKVLRQMPRLALRPLFARPRVEHRKVGCAATARVVVRDAFDVARPDRQIALPTATAGIRGTGVYAEVFADQDQRGYLCNCYGTVELTAGGERLVSQSSYHQSFWAEPAPRNGRLLTPAGAINHTDEEMEFLARLVNQRTAWQISGVKGIKDGGGRLPGGNSYGPPGSRD